MSKINDQIKCSVLNKTPFNHPMKNTKLFYSDNVGILSHYNQSLLIFDRDTYEPIDILIPKSTSSLRRLNIVLGLTDKILHRTGESEYTLYQNGKVLIKTDQNIIARINNLYISYNKEEFTDYETEKKS